jgi:hypothetical protein
MKRRILTGWNLQRFAFLGLGIMVIAASIQEQQWVGVLFGAYFGGMGLLGLGCAGRNCAVAPHDLGKPSDQEVEYEEIQSR